jgi:predicted nucleic acid-binding protein
LTIYCDTSLLVAAVIGEDASERVLAWFAENAGEKLAISDWCVTEFSSALSVKLRNAAVSLDQRAEALTAWSSMRKTSLIGISVLPEHFLVAATYCEHAELGLRAGDALHLAIAASNGCAIATLDKVQSKAAIEFGIPVEAI